MKNMTRTILLQSSVCVIFFNYIYIRCLKTVKMDELKVTAVSR